MKILGTNNVTITPMVGELLRPVTMSEETFLSLQSKLKGMNEHTTTFKCRSINNIPNYIFKTANVASCHSSSSNIYRCVKYKILVYPF